MEGFIVICVVVLGSVIAGVKLYRSGKGDIGCSCCGKNLPEADRCECDAGNKDHKE